MLIFYYLSFIIIMKSCSPQKGIITQTNDDQSSSIRSSRKSFKRLQRSPMRNIGRSSSKQSTSDVYKNCYIKDICSQHLSGRFDIKINESEQVKKKREPTPCKSRKLINNLSSSSFQKQLERVKLMESNLAIEELKQQLKQRQNNINKIEFQNRIQKQQILNLQKQVYQMKQKNSILQYEINEAREKIAKLEETIMQREQNLNNTKNSLQKLKKAIQQNRVNDIKKQNQSFKVKINCLNEDIAKLSQNIQNKEKQIAQMEKENKLLKKKVEADSKIKNESMRENYLQNQINKLRQILADSASSWTKQALISLEQSEKEKSKLRNEVNKLMIQLNYIQRKHLEQIKIFTRAKGQELIAYKRKYKTLQLQFLNKKREWEQNLKAQTNLPHQNQMRNRISKNSIMHFSGDDNRNRRLSTSFELSPE